MRDATNAMVHTMALLWRSSALRCESRLPGPKPRLSVDDIVESAIAVADAHGSASMRAVAEELGVTAMALYGYVPTKEVLVALMYDAIHAEVADDHASLGRWRSGVAEWAEDLLDLYVRHPWALAVSYARPVLGPHEQQALESVVAVLRETGLEPGLLRRVVGMLFHLVRGTAHTIAESRQASESSGIPEQDWWEESSAALSSVVPDFPDRFPHTMWLMSDPAASPEDGRSYVDRQSRANFSVGLEVLLDGVEARMR